MTGSRKHMIRSSCWVSMVYCLNLTNLEAPSLLSQSELSDQFSCRDDNPSWLDWDSIRIRKTM